MLMGPSSLERKLIKGQNSQSNDMSQECIAFKNVIHVAQKICSSLFISFSLKTFSFYCHSSLT